MTMPPGVRLGWDLATIAGATGGALVGAGPAITHVTTDSRSDLDGALFVAVRGERHDGHDFARAALDAGAAAVLVDTDLPGLEPRIVVTNTEDALLALAALRRSELTVPVIAVTGSSGKTSTKDLIAGAIPGAWASPRSYNNEIGVPLTVLATPPDAAAVVIEVGSRGPGHIAALAPAIRPDVAVVTNLGSAHLEMFGTPANLADAKYELVAMLGPRGTAVVPADEPRLLRRTDATTVTFGVGIGDVRASTPRLDADGYPAFSLTVGDRMVETRLSVAGAHQATNAAAAIAAVVAIGIDLAEGVAAMAGATGSPWRMDVHRGRFTVVNDAYNANPQSVAAALETVAGMEANHRYAVLGTMRELGPICQQAHRDIGALAARLGFDGVLVVGEDHGYSLGAGDLTVNAAGLGEAADTLRAVVEPGDVVLVKASRATGLERLALTLAEEAAR